GLPTLFKDETADRAAVMDFPGVVVTGNGSRTSGNCWLGNDGASFSYVQYIEGNPNCLRWLRFEVAPTCEGTWTAVAPPPRRQFAMAYDSVRQRTVLFGGYQSSAPLPDTWEFDGSNWRRQYTEGPPTMVGGAMAFDGSHGK